MLFVFWHPLFMEIVLAKNTKGGRRYLTQKDVLIEVAPISHKDPRPRLDGRGNILVWVIDLKGEPDKTRQVPVPLGYKLRDPNPEPIVPGKRGRRPHADKTWRGWAHSHPEVPTAILKEAKDQGCYLVAAANYITVGWGGKKLFVVYRSGILAFDKLPKYCLPFHSEKVAGRFSVIRLELSKAVAAGLKVELVRALRQYITECKMETHTTMATVNVPGAE